MTLKEELEILRGEPIEVFTGDPMDIPCIETSDPEKLCKHPVVSVNMITYNHEPYIRQAIEGVMMQKTDFEFELVIGEDASTDKTREICFEYQKKYPDKIRVLWWHENLRKVKHPAGGNGARTRAHCRGEFIALCEGDDYWIDPLKLQKQVDVMRKHPNVHFSFCGAEIKNLVNGRSEIWNDNFFGFEPGIIPARKFALWTMFGKNPPYPWGPEFFVMTCTFMVRASVFAETQKEFDIFNWRLNIGDTTIALSMASKGDVYYISDSMAVHLIAPTGATCSNTAWASIDNKIVRLYFYNKIFGGALADVPSTTIKSMYEGILLSFLKKDRCAQRPYVRQLMASKAVRGFFLNRACWPGLVCMWFGLLNSWTFLWLMRINNHIPLRWCPKRLRKLYAGLKNDGQMVGK